MIPAHLRRANQLAISRPGGVSTTRMVSGACGADDMLNGFTTIPPGAAIAWHFHNCEESVLVIGGRGLAEIGDTAFEVAEGDVTWIPAEMPHRFRNPHADRDLQIFWTYASAGATRTMVETGETRTIDAEHHRAAEKGASP